MEQQALLITTAQAPQAKVAKSETSSRFSDDSEPSFSSQLEKYAEVLVSKAQNVAANNDSPEPEQDGDMTVNEDNGGKHLPHDDAVSDVLEVINSQSLKDTKVIIDSAELADGAVSDDKTLIQVKATHSAIASSDETEPTLTQNPAEEKKDTSTANANVNKSLIAGEQELQPPPDSSKQQSNQATTPVLKSTTSTIEKAPDTESKTALSAQGLTAKTTNDRLDTSVVNSSDTKTQSVQSNTVAAVSSSPTLEQLTKSDFSEKKPLVNSSKASAETPMAVSSKAVSIQSEEHLVKQNGSESNQVSQQVMAIVKQTEKSSVVSEAAMLTPLRPDILNALAKRTANTADKSSFENANKTELSLTPVTVAGKELMTEKTQIAQSLTQERTDKVIATSLSSASSVIERREANPALTAIQSPSALSLTASVAIRTDSPVFDIQPSIQSAAWTRVLSGRVIWMAKEGVQEASLKLNPVSLGPIEVKLQVQHEQASVSFVAQNVATRDALEQALPRLKETFAQNGLELENADVSHQSSEQESMEHQAQQTHAKVAGVSESHSEELDVLDNHQQTSEPAGVNLYA